MQRWLLDNFINAMCVYHHNIGCLIFFLYKCPLIYILRWTLSTSSGSVVWYQGG